jgi:CDP-glucose 4,6-dehydratase
VYQNLEKDYAYKEDDKLGGYDPYSASKAATEIAVDSYRNSFFNIDNIAIHKKAIATVRAGNVIGGGDRSKDRLIPDVIHSLEQGSSVNIRNPKSIRPWQHVLDPLYGYLVLGIKLSEDPVNASSAFNLGPDKVDMITVEEVVKKAINIWGEGSYSISSQQKTFHEAGILMLDNSKAKKILEVRPKYRTEKALELTMRWYKEAESRYIQYSLEQIEQFMNEIA